MKLIIKILFLVVLALSLSACTSEAPVSKDAVSEELPAVNESLPIVSLDDVSSVEVLVGQKMVYGYDLWPSVGYDADYSIGEPDVVAFLGYEENIPDAEYPGGDDGSGTFYFVAKSPGSTIIEIEHLFRGDVEKTVNVRVNVK